MYRGRRQPFWSLARRFPNVPVNDLAVCHVIDTPQGIHNLVSRQQSPGIGRKQIQEILLQWGQVQLAGAGAHPTIEDIDFKLPHPNGWSEGDAGLVRAAHHRQRAGQQLLRRKGDSEQVVDNSLERSERRLEVAPPGQGDYRRTLDGRRQVSQLLHHVSLVYVHVDQREMGMPVLQHLRSGNRI